VNDLKVKEDELEVVKKELVSKTQKIDDLCKQLMQKEQTHKENVKTKESHHEEQIEAMGKTIEEAKNQSSFLKDQMAGLKVEHDLNIEKFKMEQDFKINTMQGEFDKKAAQLAKLKEDFANKEEEAAFLKEELENKTDELEEATADLDIKEASFSNENKELLELHQVEVEELISKNEAINADIGNLQEKIVRQKAEFDSKMDNIIKERKEEVNNLKDTLSEKERNAMDLEAKIKSLEEQNSSLESTITSESSMATQKMEKLSNENEELRRNKYELQSSVNNVSTERDHIVHLNEDLGIRIVESERQVQEFRSQYESLTQEYKKQQLMLIEKEEKTLLDLGSIEEMQKAIDAEALRVDELQVALGETESERDRLLGKVGNLETSNNELIKTHDINEKLEEEINDLQKKNEFLFEEIAREKLRLEAKLETLAEQLDEKTKECSISSFQLTQLESENSQLNGYKRSVLMLEQEKRDLESQLAQVTVESRKRVVKSPSPASTIDSNLNEDQEALKGQIEFLNSVIVDMHGKNDELKNKLELYESAGILDDTAEFYFNGVSSRQAAPRLFCDICDEFDVHDTEECPTQSMMAGHADSPEKDEDHSKHGSKRGVSREYCETCEIFGHQTQDCNEGETF